MESGKEYKSYKNFRAMEMNELFRNLDRCDFEVSFYESERAFIIFDRKEEERIVGYALDSIMFAEKYSRLDDELIKIKSEVTL